MCEDSGGAEGEDIGRSWGCPRRRTDMILHLYQIPCNISVEMRCIVGFILIGLLGVPFTLNSHEANVLTHNEFIPR